MTDTNGLIIMFWSTVVLALVAIAIHWWMGVLDKREDEEEARRKTAGKPRSAESRP